MDETLKTNRHKGMQNNFQEMYGDEELADKLERVNKKQVEEEAIEAETGTD